MKLRAYVNNSYACAFSMYAYNQGPTYKHTYYIHAYIKTYKGKGKSQYISQGSSRTLLSLAFSSGTTTELILQEPTMTTLLDPRNVNLAGLTNLASGMPGSH